MPYQTDISFQLHNLSHLLKRRMEHSLTCCHIDDTVSRNNGWILGYLAHHPDQNVFQKDIENAFCVRRSTVSKVIRLMETKGLIRDGQLFVLQELISDYHNDLLPGTYDLNTSMTAEQMMEIMSAEPETEEEEGSKSLDEVSKEVVVGSE